MIALDAPSERVIKELANIPWQRATFFTASAFAGAQQSSERASERFSLGGWLNDLAGRTKNLVEEIAGADLVVMVASAGENAWRGGHHRRGLQSAACDDDGAHPRHCVVQR